MDGDGDHVAKNGPEAVGVRLVIFSPLTASSAIGRVTRLVVGSLAEQGHDVVVVRSEDRRLLDTPGEALAVRTVRWTDGREVRDAADEADGVVYQIGNSFDFHRGCLEWLPRRSGIVCLHDFFLGDLFLAWAQRHRKEAESVLRVWYGDDLLGRYFSFADASFIEETFELAPLTEWVASMAQGVITHSSWGVAPVLRSCPGPVRVVALPYDAPAMAERAPRQEAGTQADFTVLTVGHINANKRVASVIRAIGESERLRRATLYRLVGRIERAMEEELLSLAASLDVRISISGEVSDDALREAIAESDVVCCLRLPALEAASASAIEAMLYAKAVVVMDTGFYTELPDEYVRKVSPEREITDLRRQLEALHGDPVGRVALGRAAAAWSERTFRADNYAANLTEHCSQVAAAAPALEASRYFAETLVRWGASERWLPTSEIVAPLRIFDG